MQDSLFLEFLLGGIQSQLIPFILHNRLVYQQMDFSSGFSSEIWFFQPLEPLQIPLTCPSPEFLLEGIHFDLFTLFSLATWHHFLFHFLLDYYYYYYYYFISFPPSLFVVLLSPNASLITSTSIMIRIHPMEEVGGRGRRYRGLREGFSPMPAYGWYPLSSSVPNYPTSLGWRTFRGCPYGSLWDPALPKG